MPPDGRTGRHSDPHRLRRSRASDRRPRTRVRVPDPGAHADIEVLDVLAISNVLFRKLYAGGYLGLVRHAPAAMGWLYEAMDRPNGRLQDTVRIGIQNLNKLPTVRYLLRRRPQLIVNTHYLPAEIVSQMRRAGQLDCPQVTVTTDYDTHRIWVQEPTERYYTATEDGKVYLTTSGPASESILVTGIPVRPGFDQPLSRDEARRRCQLDPARPVVLLLCGGFGVGPIAELLRELILMPADAQVVVIAGRNEKLRQRLDAQIRAAKRPAPRRRVYRADARVDARRRRRGDQARRPDRGRVAGLRTAADHRQPHPRPGNPQQRLPARTWGRHQGQQLAPARPPRRGPVSGPSPAVGACAPRRAIARPQAARDIAADALRVLASRRGTAVSAVTPSARRQP